MRNDENIGFIVRGKRSITYFVRKGYVVVIHYQVTLPKLI